jgi:transposase
LKETREAEKKEIPIILILNAIFYVLKTGCQWMILPKDFRKCKTVYHYFSLWNNEGIIKKVHKHLRSSLREVFGKDKDLSLGIVDSQCVKTSFMAREDKGFNGEKLVKGRKRNIFVDSLGLLWGLSVSPANQSEIEGAIECLNRGPSQIPKLRKILFDGGYKGVWFQRFIEGCFGCATEILERGGERFDVQAFRWIVERTFSWFEGFGGYPKIMK